LIYSAPSAAAAAKCGFDVTKVKRWAEEALC
jgi:hypothetical protein